MPDDRDSLLDELADALRAEVGPTDGPDERRVAALRDAAWAKRLIATPPAARAPRRLWGGKRLDAAPAPRRRLAPALAFGAAAALAAGIVVGGALERDDAGRPPAGTLEYAGAIERLDGRRAGTLEVREIGIGRTVDLRTGALPLLPRGRYYEVWFVGPDDRPGRPDRISAGTFHPDRAGRSDVVFKAAVDPALYPEVEITDEPGDGNPAATGRPVLRADLDP